MSPKRAIFNLASALLLAICTPVLFAGGLAADASSSHPLDGATLKAAASGTYGKVAVEF